MHNLNNTTTFKFHALSLGPMNYLINILTNNSGVKARIPVVKEDVMSLESSNFDKVVKDNKNDVLVEFYAPCEYGSQILLSLL
jgi:hypothetical protein